MLITVGGFFMTSIGVTTSAIYFFVLVCNILSLFMFYFTIPVTTMKHNGQSFGDFIQSMKVITTWGPAITWHSTALMVNMFFVSMNSVMLYIYNDAKVVPLWGSNSDVLVNHDDYFVFFNLALMMGDSFSRKLVYWYYTSDKPLPNPWYWLVFSVLGAGICFLKLAFIAPLGAFFVMFANGGIYAISTKHIDRNVLKEFNLVALSVWLFVGDIGSFTGSNMIPYIQDIVCSKHFEYVCEQN
jgi:hypothetical protein